MPETAKTVHLRDLWDSAVAASSPTTNRPAALSLQSARRGPANHQFRRRQHQLQNRAAWTRSPAVRGLAVKGSGGDIGSITESGFAILYLDRLEQLKSLYRGEAIRRRDGRATIRSRRSARIALPRPSTLPCTLSSLSSRRPSASRTGPSPLRPAPTASENWKSSTRSSIARLSGSHGSVPDSNSRLLIEKAVQDNPGAEGIILGGHGLFTWGMTQRDCYLNSIHTIDQMGEFIEQHQAKKGPIFGGLEHSLLPDRRKVATQILPALRGAVSSNRRVIAHYADDEDALTFAGSKWAKELGRAGHKLSRSFSANRVCPLFSDWDPRNRRHQNVLKTRIAEQVVEYRADYKKYYEAWATADSPKLRDSNPSVVIIPGVGLFGFGKNKKEARITTEFFINAIHVMAGANALEDGRSRSIPCRRRGMPSNPQQFTQFHNYVALPAVRSISHRVLGARRSQTPAHARRSGVQPQDRPRHRRSQRHRARSGADARAKGAHVVVADFDQAGAKKVADEAGAISVCGVCRRIPHVDLSSAGSLAEAAELHHSRSLVASMSS